jgi:hypothetical protein
MEVGKKAAQKKAQLITALLEEKQGPEFDMCFMGLQVLAHVNAVAEIEAMQGHGSPQFQQVLTEAGRVTNQHLEQAKQLAQKVGESAGSERVTRRPEQPGGQQERP